MDEDFGGFFHVLEADPFARAVDLVHADKQIGRGQAAGGEIGTIGAATDGIRDGRKAGSTQGGAGVDEGTRIFFEAVAEVAVLLGKREDAASAGFGGAEFGGEFCEEGAMGGSNSPW